MQYVAILPAKGIIAASDTKILQAINTEISGQYPENDINAFGKCDFSILLNPKHIATVAGKTTTIHVYEYTKEEEEMDAYKRMEKVTRTYREAVMECNGETLITDTRKYFFPDVMRVIPSEDGRDCLTLDAENLDALKTICKLHKKCKNITIACGGNLALGVAPERSDYAEPQTYTLRANGCYGLIFAVDPALLLKVLVGCNGTMTFLHGQAGSRPIKVDGIGQTIIMPVHSNTETAQAARQAAYML